MPGDLPQRVHRYETPVFDSARWDGYRPRPGDIIVTTPVKSGTTWTQMLCALLVHQRADLPLPLTRLSRWLDRHAEPVEAVLADFEAQPFRRIIKTHTPLDGLPYHPEVSYVFSGRDARDVFLSMFDHVRNFSEDAARDVKRRAGLPDDFQFPDDLNESFAVWMTVGAAPWLREGFPYGSVFGLTQTYWRYRHLPNIHFHHYADLKADLAGEMRRLADFLGITIPSDKWPTLLEAASFASMKDHAEETAPGAHHGEWQSPRDFFRKARIGEWRTVLSPESQALYQRTASAFDDKMVAWIEGGRAGAGDPRTIA